MKVIGRSSPFGGIVRTRLLAAVQLLGSSYARELARLLDTPVSGVQQALKGLEADGLVVGRLVGRTRVVEINPRYFARRELLAYLARLAEVDAPLQDAVTALRRRPRRPGKPL